MIVHASIEAKLYPTLKQRVWLTKEFGDCRFVWNRTKDYADPMIREYIKLVRTKGKQDAKKQHAYPTESQLDRNLTKHLKKANRWLKIADSRSLEISIKNLLRAYQRHFSDHSGWPKFKSRKYYRQGYTTNVIPKQNHSRRSLKIPKLGWMKAHFNMPVIGKIKQMTVVHDTTGCYHASLSVKCDKQALPRTGKAVGIDVGLRYLLNLSNGMKYDFKHFSKFLSHHKHYWEKRRARRLIRAKKVIKKLSYKHRNNKTVHVPTLFEFRNYQEARKMVAKYSRHVVNQRKNYLNWLTTRLVKEYDVICIEDLKVSKMLKNHHLARSIANGAWRMFRIMLEYKCKWYGKRLVPVNKDYTTQECFNCGYNMSKHGRKLQLGTEYWTCPRCHTKHDRDTNAALNILRRGLEQALVK